MPSKASPYEHGRILEKEVKKSKGHLNVIKRVSKATDTIVCAV